LSAALDKLLGNGIDMIDEECILKAFQGVKNGRANAKQTITDLNCLKNTK